MIRRLWLVFAQGFVVVVPAVANIYTAKMLWREMSEGDRLFNATAEAWALI